MAMERENRPVRGAGKRRKKTLKEAGVIDGDHIA